MADTELRDLDLTTEEGQAALEALEREAWQLHERLSQRAAMRTIDGPATIRQLRAEVAKGDQADNRTLWDLIGDLWNVYEHFLGEEPATKEDNFEQWSRERTERIDAAKRAIDAVVDDPSTDCKEGKIDLHILEQYVQECFDRLD
jgi:hypothetical protein